ncbi:GNAT family N-acetyltransferase [Paucibacter sp. R3-3]|uniref:GNAT family N-acetyltransferase n=1 Tax=Roseateles agri TaxID=3098619 RepID=A0ABU5D9P5_9BURK|nr:GNAT family N-acetyltransferase [Paucibacter sp. R3-3]MDY0742984.1 GNAT family N-acetyltransferase [Paucibacter sp. R3-3]
MNDRFCLRLLTPADLPEIWRVRHAVQENRLAPDHTITVADVIERMAPPGRGWGVELPGGKLAGFAIACGAREGADAGRIWALFVHPDHAAQGHGRRLHDEMVGWLRGQGLTRLWLNTQRGSRAETFYRLSGWVDCGPRADGHDDETRFELPLTTAP